MSGQLPKPGWSLLSNRSGTTISTTERPVDVAAATAPVDVDAATARDGATPADVASLDAPGGNGLATDPIAPAAAAAGAPSESAVAAPTAAVTDGSEFLVKLATAMHTTAARERTTIADDAERRRQAQVQAIRERAAHEVERIRELAAEDMKAIETWAEGEANRIKLEREQRVTALNEDLELSLTEHGAKIDEEVKAAETAIAAYRTAVDAFFAGLDQETDSVIARQAASHPVIPMLAETPATVSRGADAGAAMVGVMSPAPAGRSLEAATAAIVGSPTLIGEPSSDPSVGPVHKPVLVGAYVGPGGSDTGQDVSALQALLAARLEGRPGPEANGTDRDSRS